MNLPEQLNMQYEINLVLYTIKSCHIKSRVQGRIKFLNLKKTMPWTQGQIFLLATLGKKTVIA